MRTEKFKGALLSTLILISLTAPVVTLLSVGSVGQVSAQIPPENIVVRGDANSYTSDKAGDPPWTWYEAGDNPPIITAKRIGSGAVVAGGLGRTVNGGVTYTPARWTVGELDVLLDKAFQWMVPGAKKVLWYGTEADNVYSDASRCSWLIDNLREEHGYTVDGKGGGITAALLTGYDILVLPPLQFGAPGSGGDPTPLQPENLNAIKTFVEGGKGLFIMESGDHDSYNYYKVTNTILENLGFGMYFQDDAVVDPITDPEEEKYVTAEVTANLFGGAYQAATGKTTVTVYKVCTLAPERPAYGVRVKILPGYRAGLAGGTLEYKVRVFNTGKTTDNFDLTATDTAGWGLSLGIPKLLVENGKFKDTTLRVTISSGASIGALDNVTVTATSEDNTLVSHSSWTLAIVEKRVRPSTGDTQAVEGDATKTHGVFGWMYVGSSFTGKYLDERAFIKFDLRAMGTAPVENVRLYVYCFTMMGKPDMAVRLHRVDEPWDEDNLTWNNQPALGAALGDATVSDADLWYSWDVTSYVAGRRGIDNLASFALSFITENAKYPDNWSYGFDTKEYAENLKHPYLAVGRSVRAMVRPSYNEGLRDGTLKYTIIVQNTGALHDTYSLAVGDNAGWVPTVSPTSLTLAPGASGTATVTVTIPSGAPTGENIDNITLKVTSNADSSVFDNIWFVANVSSTKIRPPKDDSTVKEGDPEGNWAWGTEPNIVVGRDLENRRRGFLKFDLSAIPASIAGARLWLYCSRADNGGAVVQVRSVTDDSWIERGAGRLMWGNQPSIGEVLDVRGVAGEGWYSWDVTSFVASEFAGDKLASFALVDFGENITPNHSALFTARDNFRARDKHPYLEILTAAPARAVRVYITPAYEGGAPPGSLISAEPGATLTYRVIVKNTGTLSDTYKLENRDLLGWGLSLDNATLAVPANENRTTTLRVKVPSGSVCTVDGITVTATSLADENVKDSAGCIAHISKASFALENLYKVMENLKLRLPETAANLVTKFYTYGGSYQGESVVWSGDWPATGYYENVVYISDPTWGAENKGIERAKLVVTDAGGNEILTAATFTVTRSVLWERILKIKGRWLFAGGPERDALWKEILAIKGKWLFAPA